MNYIIKQQFYRIIAIALMAGYAYLQLRSIATMSRLDWYMVSAVVALGVVVIIVTTAKIKIASAHVRHHRQERGQS